MKYKRAKVGDICIINFDDSQVVGLVLKSDGKNDLDVLVWEKISYYKRCMPRYRVLKATPKTKTSNIKRLSIKDVSLCRNR